MKRTATGLKFALTVAAIGLIYAPAGSAAQITLNAPNCPDLNWDSSTKTLTCSNTSTTPSNPTTGYPPSACTASVIPNTVAAGGKVEVAIVCSGGDAATEYNWSANPSANVNGLSTSTSQSFQSVTVSQTTTFTVTAKNAVGSSSSSATVTVNASGGTTTPPTQPSGPLKCGGFESTKVMDLTFPANGGATTWYRTYNSVFSQGSPGWGANDAVVLRFTAPSGGDQLLRVRLASEGLLVTRTVALSTQPCEFKMSGTTIFVEEVNDFVVSMQSGSVGGQAIKLNPGQVYYINMANIAGGNNTCPGQCDASISAQNPKP